MGFGDSVKMSAERMKKSVNNNVLATATKLFNIAVSLTPVANNMTWRGNTANPGELINNWQTGYGVGVVTKVYNYHAANILGSDSYQRIAEIKSSVIFIGKDSEVSLSNMSPYGFRAEYVGWPEPSWSGLSKPYAMMRRAINEIGAK